jgi:hypothetical protein
MRSGVQRVDSVLWKNVAAKAVLLTEDGQAWRSWHSSESTGRPTVEGKKCSAEFRAVLNLSILQRHARVPEQRLRSFAWASNLLTVFIFSYDLMLFEVSRGVATLLEPTRRGSSPLPRIAEAAIFYAAHATQLPTCGSPASRVGPIGPSRPITHHGANEC